MERFFLAMSFSIGIGALAMALLKWLLVSSLSIALRVNSAPYNKAVATECHFLVSSHRYFDHFVLEIMFGTHVDVAV